MNYQEGERPWWEMGPSMMGFEQTDNQTEEKVAKIIHRRKKKSMPHLMEKDKVTPIPKHYLI